MQQKCSSANAKHRSPSSKIEARRSLTRVKAKLAALVASPALTRVGFVQERGYEGDAAAMVSGLNISVGL